MMTQTQAIIAMVLGFTVYTAHAIAERPAPPRESVWRWRLWCLADALSFLTPDRVGGDFKLPGTSSDSYKQIVAADLAKKVTDFVSEAPTNPTGKKPLCGRGLQDGALRFATLRSRFS